MLFVTVLMMLISISIYLFLLFCFVVCVIQNAYNHQERSLFMPFFFTVHWGCKGVSFWETWTIWSSSAFWPKPADFSKCRTTQVEWNLRLWSDQHLFGTHSLEDVFHREGYHHYFIFLSFQDFFFFFLILLSQEVTVPLQLRKSLSSSPHHHIPDKTLEGHTRPCCFY